MGSAMKEPRFTAAFVAAALMLTVAESPAADPPRDKAAAESLFRAAQQLMQQGNYAEACLKFAESQRFDPTLGTQLNLARCHEKEGKTATAWAEYQEVAVLARKQNQKERADTAADLASKLEATLSKLRIEAPGAPPGLVITRDKTEVGRGSLGVAVAVDPGEHTVTATAPGYKPWSQVVVVGANAEEKTVTVPALEKEAAPPPPPPPPSSNTRRTVGFVVGGVGVAAAGIGAVFGVLTLNDASRAEEDPALCPGKVCTKAGRDAIDSAEVKGVVSTVCLSVGLAAAGVGTFLVLTSGGDEPKKEGRSRGVRVSIAPHVGPHAGGLTLIGAF
jgi:hypothetical protein